MAKSSVLAVFVSHNPVINLLTENIDSVLKQGCDCYIVDNASRDTIQFACYNDSDRVTLDLQKQNLGLGAAQNIGIRAAQQGGYDYVLLLDQDSHPDLGMVAALLRAHQLKSEYGQVAAVGPIYRNAQNGSESFFVRFGYLKFQRVYRSQADSHGCIAADFLISSGSLFNLHSISEIGLMDELLFIDHVDTEWFLRAKSLGFSSFGVTSATMTHDLGEDTHRIKLGGRQRNVPQHKPFRYYYIFRNSVLLYKRTGISLLWKWNDLQRLVMIIVMFGLFTPPRLGNLKMMLLGIWHGILGRSGKLKQLGLANRAAKP
jgi:rhamnosyltransferase